LGRLLDIVSIILIIKMMQIKGIITRRFLH
jgi:hypothetical protein